MLGDFRIYIMISGSHDNDNITPLISFIKESLHQSFLRMDEYKNCDLTLSNSIHDPQIFETFIRDHSNDNSKCEVIYIVGSVERCNLVNIHDEVIDTIKFISDHFSVIKNQDVNVSIIYDNDSAVHIATAYRKQYKKI